LNKVLVTRDGPPHTQLRAIVASVFTNAKIAALRLDAEQRVEQLLNRAAECGSFDAVAELGYPLPIYVLSRLFGLPENECDCLGRRVLLLSKLFSPEITPADRVAADTAVAGLQDYFTGLCAERSRRPGDDLVSVLGAAGKHAGVELAEMADNAIFVMFAGLETTMNLIAAGCAALAQHPSELARLRRGAVAAPTAVHECLRYDPPTQMTGRIALSPVEIAGRVLPKGRIVLLVLASANRDADRFASADAFDLGRDPNPHVSFGGGAHYCVGAKLALSEAAITFEAIARRFARFAPAGPSIREPVATPRSYLNVPITVRPV
jgi:cytochrome P450